MRNFRWLCFGLFAALILVGCKSKANPAPLNPTINPASTAISPSGSPISATPVTTAALPGGVSPTPTPEGLSPTSAAPLVSETPEAGTRPTQPAQPTPTGEAATPALPSPTPDCLNQAVFVEDVTIPDGTIFRPNTPFTKTWRIYNSGTCDWDAGYSLAFAGGDIMNGPMNQALTPIGAGETGDISVNLTAPARGGQQTGYWMFQEPGGQRFGMGLPATNLMWVQVNVTFVDEAGQPVGSAVLPGNDAAGFANQPAPGGDDAGGETQEEAGAEASDPGSYAIGNCKPTQNQAFVDEILRLVNQGRIDNGLSRVFLQDQLTAAAMKHSVDMACHRFVDHNGSDGSTWYDRVRFQGYANPASARENIYAGDPAFGANAAFVYNWWMNSPVHRDNILFATVTEIGIGYVYLPGSPAGGYFTLVLGKR